MNTVRLFPIVVVAVAALALLKSASLFSGGKYVLSGVEPASAQSAKASAAKDKAASPEKPAKAKAAEGASGKAAAGADLPGPGKKAEGTPGKSDPAKSDTSKKSKTSALSSESRSERALLERLAERRQLLEKREQDMALRENLLKAAEKRVEGRISELKAIEARIEEAFVKQDQAKKAQYKRVVKMYAAMKPKDAARIFNRLDLDILVGVAKQMSPGAMAAILAAMDSAAAERLTVEIAMPDDRARKREAALKRSLPKIEGSSSTN